MQFSNSPPRDASSGRRPGSYDPGDCTGSYRIGGDIVVRDTDGRSYISGEDFAIAFVDEIESEHHRNKRFTVGY